MTPRPAREREDEFRATRTRRDHVVDDERPSRVNADEVNLREVNLRSDVADDMERLAREMRPQPEIVCHSNYEPEPCEPLRALKEKLGEVRAALSHSAAYTLEEEIRVALARIAEAEDLISALEERAALGGRR